MEEISVRVSGGPGDNRWASCSAAVVLVVHWACRKDKLEVQHLQHTTCCSIPQQHPFFFTGVVGFDGRAVHPLGSGALAQVLRWNSDPKKKKSLTLVLLTGPFLDPSITILYTTDQLNVSRCLFSVALFANLVSYCKLEP